MKVYLINDTTSCHAGSKQVMDNLRYYLRNHDIVRTMPVGMGKPIQHSHIDEVDAIVVNAEGSIHHNSQWGIYILQALEYAQKMGKKTYLLNALYEKMDKKFDHIIEKCDVVMARELYSYRTLHELNPNTMLYPDFCVLRWENDGKAFGNYEGSVCKTQTHFASIYKNAFASTKVPVVSVSGKRSFKDTIETYSGMEILLTGQHHAVYASLMAGTPFIPTFGNSHKIESFLEWMDIPVMMCSNAFFVRQEMLKIRQGEYDEAFTNARTKLFEEADRLHEKLEEIFNV